MNIFVHSTNLLYHMAQKTQINIAPKPHRHQFSMSIRIRKKAHDKIIT